MVGDPKELPATILSNVASKYLYECSMFERLQRAGHPVIMLTEQLTWSNVSIQAEGLPWCRFPFLAKFSCEKRSDEEEATAAERASEVNFADEISGINIGPPSPTSSINY
ncbi:uncharacterized protein LOC110264961 [Arachis ipaensis]|uniref:uncharacterized protein LOC110264961 n=1 Tax=Arachis ipaensis TaxID=130454 RepID=UPI000A2B5ED0|nr:uncharacterized protein LOC110264961 [Arachis ipaensis]